MVMGEMEDLILDRAEVAAPKEILQAVKTMVVQVVQEL
jgi:hypothetical protein